MRMWIRNVVPAVAIILLIVVSGHAGEDDWLIRAQPESKEKPPRTIDAAESMTGNAAPVVPQRQSERKKPPEPDYLVGKVIWGESATYTDPEGGEMQVDDWNLVPGDVPALMDMAGKVGQQYHWSNVHLDEFSYDPEKLPVLFISGVRNLRLNDSHMQALRRYVLRGGTIVLDSVYGSPHFTRSARRTFDRMFPGRRFRSLPTDHPLLKTYHEIDSLDYPLQPEEDDPHLEVIYVGARAGVLLSPFGFGTGLVGDQEVFERLQEKGLEPRYMAEESARRFAMNVVGYSVGYADVGRIQGRPEELEEADADSPSDQFVFAQLRHEGAWNTHPGAAASLLKEMRRDSAFRIYGRRVAVDPGEDDLSPYPFLYMTGLDTFEFSDSETRALGRYLENGGFLVINNGLGLSRFHSAAKKELQKLHEMLAGSRLEMVEAEHDIFDLLVRADRVRYTSRLRSNHPDLGNTPMLLGLKHEDELVAIYSPYDLEAGWLSADFPLMRGYENRSARRLGMNIVAYSMIR